MVKIGIALIVSERWEMLDVALKSAEGLYDYLSICIVSFKGAKTAKTLRIAKKHEAIISHYKVKDEWKHKFIDDFSAPRNIAIEALPEDTDWVFILDSDDRVENPILARQEIEGVPKESSVIVAIGLIDTKTNAGIMQARIFPYGKGYYAGRIHEQITAFKGDTLETIFNENIRIYHKVTAAKKHRDRNGTILEDAIAGGEARLHEVFLYAEIQYMQSMDGKGDMELAKRAIKTFETLKNKPELAEASFKAYCYMAEYEIRKVKTQNKGELHQALTYAMEAIARSLYYPEPYYLVGQILYVSGKPHHAVPWLKHAIDIPEHLTAWHSLANFRMSMVYETLAVIYLEAQDRKQAHKYHALARMYDPPLKGYDEMFGIYTEAK